MWGALSDERTGLSFARVTVSCNTSVVSMYNLHAIKCIYNIYEASVSPGCLQQNMPFALNVMTLRGLWILVAILLHEI
jgi:hypothetical protein